MSRYVFSYTRAIRLADRAHKDRVNAASSLCGSQISSANAALAAAIDAAAGTTREAAATRDASVTTAQATLAASIRSSELRRQQDQAAIRAAQDAFAGIGTFSDAAGASAAVASYVAAGLAIDIIAIP